MGLGRERVYREEGAGGGEGGGKEKRWGKRRGEKAGRAATEKREQDSLLGLGNYILVQNLVIDS